MIKNQFTLCLLMLVITACSQNSDQETFTISEDKLPYLLVANEEDLPVKTAVKHFVADVKTITDLEVKATTTTKVQNAIIIGTLGKSPIIDSLVNTNVLDISTIKDQKEAYQIKTLTNNALVIVGSDTRGTAYGIYTLSEKIGMSPWYWFADVTPIKKTIINLDAIDEKWIPTVAYRGIFINDEIWGIQTWSKKNFAPSEKLLGPKVYQKIFELLMRLKANHIWPSMWAKGKKSDWPAFYHQQANIDLANEYGIIMGASHGESLNTAPAEWANWTEENNTSAAWNYAENYPNMKSFWEERLQTSTQAENLYTVGLRGLNDEPMEGGSSMKDKIAIVEEAIHTQRQLIGKATGKPSNEVPQIFCPYKEVLPLFENGLKIPDDVTILYTDDNFGYLRKIPDLTPRKGGYGMYYHLDYYGGPKSYIWMGGNPMALVNLEMQKSFDLGIQTAWIANVGNIKMHEPVMEYFLHLAANIGTERELSPQAFTKMWAAREFTPEVAESVEEILTEMERLNFIRKPDHAMQGQFSPDEGTAYLAHFDNLLQKVNTLKNRIPDHRKNAFHQLVVFPVEASYFTHAMFFYETQHYRHRTLGSKMANDYGDSAIVYQNKLQEATRAYNEDIANGKWNHFMYGPQGGHNWKVPWKPNFKPHQPEIVTVNGEEGLDWGILLKQERDEVGATKEAIETKTLQFDPQKANTFFENLNDWKVTQSTIVSPVNNEKLPWESLGSAPLLIEGSLSKNFSLTLEVKASHRIGLLFGFKDNENFSWVEMAKNSMDTQTGSVVGGGRIPITWNESFSWSSGEWKKVRLIKKNHQLEVYVDEILIMYTVNNNLRGLLGKIGISCREGSMDIRAIQLAIAAAVTCEPTDRLPPFVKGKSNQQTLELFSKGKLPVNWRAETDQEWLSIKPMNGIVETGEEIDVAIDWAKINNTSYVEGKIDFFVNDEIKTVNVEAHHAKTNNHVVAAGHTTHLDLTEVSNSDKIGFIEGLGRDKKMMKIVSSNSIKAIEIERAKPLIVYDLDVQQEGSIEVGLHILPTRPVYPAEHLRYAIAIDEETPQIVDLTVRSSPWGTTTLATLHGNAVFNNKHSGFTQHEIKQVGQHQLKIWPLDNGLVISAIDIKQHILCK